MFTTRFAPSPTGRLHLGHAFSALTAWNAARESGGRFLLRIENIDPTRCHPEFEAGIYEDLAWLGLAWEPPVRRQSEHIADYAAAIDRLRTMGVLYRCFLTRTEVAAASLSAPHGAEGPIYLGPVNEMSIDEQDARIAKGEPYAWRLSLRYSQDLLGEQFARLVFREEDSGPNGEHGIVHALPALHGDVILARKDSPASYHLAVVNDDALQNVTHVIRGRDLYAAAHIQVLIQTLLGLPTPIYRHHALQTGPDGKRYAKRDQSLTLATLRSDGATPADIRRRLGFAD